MRGTGESSARGNGLKKNLLPPSFIRLPPKIPMDDPPNVSLWADMCRKDLVVGINIKIK